MTKTKIYNFYFQIDEALKDHLPSKVCFKCSEALLTATQIRSLCIESDKLLKKQLVDSGIIAIAEPVIEKSYKVEEEEEEATSDHEYVVEDYLEDDFEESIQETVVVKTNDCKTIEEKMEEEDLKDFEFKPPPIRSQQPSKPRAKRPPRPSRQAAKEAAANEYIICQVRRAEIKV